MDQELLDSMARLLREQRKRFLQEFRKAERGLEALAEERESELEEHAQEEQSERLLARLDDRTLHAVQEIDAALRRILSRTYGKCEGCHKPISISRLRSLPETRFCRRCAARSEVQTAPAGAAREAQAKYPAPADLSLLSDSELVETIHEHLKEDGRLDMEELHVACRKGVVALSGALPSEAEHQILLQTLTDVLGFKDIVDHVHVEAILWQSDGRTKDKPPEATTRWEDSPGTDNIVESNEEGKDFVAPAKPTPGEE
ncbi:MAG: TraR/DksA C4-type zinc finger protein [Deltaproteobacteria bacterium]|nr:TraR/DksA C4-type zinc finger protein [Deltaproteobacteria bacterium]